MYELSQLAPQGSGVFRGCPAVLIEAVGAEGFGGNGVVAPSFGDVQVAGIFPRCPLNPVTKKDVLDLVRDDESLAGLSEAQTLEASMTRCAPLAAAVAAQGLAFIDRAAAVGAVTDGTLELVLPGWQWRRRTWPRHRDCSCGSTSFRRGE